MALKDYILISTGLLKVVNQDRHISKDNAVHGLCCRIVIVKLIEAALSEMLLNMAHSGHLNQYY